MTEETKNVQDIPYLIYRKCECSGEKPTTFEYKDYWRFIDTHLYNCLKCGTSRTVKYDTNKENK